MDWSGAVARPGIALAVVEDGDATALRPLRSRGDALAALLELRPDVVGLDFAFSLPEWWLDRHALASGPELWALAAVGSGAGSPRLAC